MKIVIAGSGKLGFSLARVLSNEGYQLTLIDSNRAVLSAGEEAYDVLTVEGNCASSDVLMSAGIMEADLLLVTTSSDEINLLCCVTAHALNPKLHTIARIRNPEYSNQVYQMRDLFALSLTVNPDLQVASEMAHLIRFPGFLKRESFAKGRAEIVELRIDADSPLCNHPLKDLDSIVKSKVLVCTVLRDGRATVPDGNFVLQSQDRIFVTASSKNLTALLKHLGIFVNRNKRALLCGGSRISYYLAQKLLDSGIKVTIIEADSKRCLRLAEQLPNAAVVHGDASNQELLLHEGIHDFDVLVSLTGLDEINIMISLYGINSGVHQVITKLGHLENSNILNYLPLNCIVNPKELSCASIVQYVRALHNQAGAAISIHRIADGQVEALEFLVDEHTKYCNVPFKNLRLKRNILICCVVTAGAIQISSGNSSYRKGDTLVIVNGSDRVIYQINDIFEE